MRSARISLTFLSVDQPLQVAVIQKSIVKTNVVQNFKQGKKIKSMVYQLIYTSRTRASIDHHVMEQIAYLAAGRNAAVDVTGILIYSKNMILQVLEGREDDVQAIYQKLCRDTRHFEVCVLGEGEVDCREFPDTPMDFKVVNCESKRGLMSALADTTPLEFAVSGQRMFA